MDVVLCGLRFHPRHRLSSDRLGKRVIALVVFITHVEQLRQHHQLRALCGSTRHQACGAFKAFASRRGRGVHLYGSDFECARHDNPLLDLYLSCKL
jgi:hypothetical protein